MKITILIYLKTKTLNLSFNNNLQLLKHFRKLKVINYQITNNKITRIRNLITYLVKIKAIQVEPIQKN